MKKYVTDLELKLSYSHMSTDYIFVYNSVAKLYTPPISDYSYSTPLLTIVFLYSYRFDSR